MSVDAAAPEPGLFRPRSSRMSPDKNTTIKEGRVDLLIVVGEHSGDEHAARMVRELRAKRPEIVVAAFGGPQLSAAGARLLRDLTASSGGGSPS